MEPPPADDTAEGLEGFVKGWGAVTRRLHLIGGGLGFRVWGQRLRELAGALGVH